MKDNTELSERLRQLRKNAGLSQEQLAETLHISRQAVSKWESGVSNPDIQNIVQLGKLYGISTDSILLEESPAPEAADIMPQTSDAAPTEEKPSVRDHNPANGFLWAVLGAVIVLVLYLVTNMF